MSKHEVKGKLDGISENLKSMSSVSAVEEKSESQKESKSMHEKERLEQSQFAHLELRDKPVEIKEEAKII